MEDPFDYQILKLTNAFYNDYPSCKFPELLLKNQRAYNCLLIQSHYDYFISIPYRSNISHNNAFLFKGTERSKKYRSGLDYSKIIVITNLDYIDNKTAIIDKDEYIKTIRHLSKIKNDALKYVDEYVDHCNGIHILQSQIFKRKYGLSTLKYFHKELGIQ